MTLVLATYLEKGFLIAADSYVGYENSTTGEVTHGLGEKLFVFDKVAIATFGSGSKVPDLINRGLLRDVTLEDAIDFLWKTFRGESGVQAYVGGLTSDGPQLFHIWPAREHRFSLEWMPDGPPVIWVGGDHEAKVEFEAGLDSAALAEKILGILRIKASESIRPPFQFVSIGAGEVPKRWQEPKTA